MPANAVACVRASWRRRSSFVTYCIDVHKTSQHGSDRQPLSALLPPCPRFVKSRSSGCVAGSAQRNPARDRRRSPGAPTQRNSGCDRRYLRKCLSEQSLLELRGAIAEQGHGANAIPLQAGNAAARSSGATVSAAGGGSIEGDRTLLKSSSVDSLPRTGSYDKLVALRRRSDFKSNSLSRWQPGDSSGSESESDLDEASIAWEVWERRVSMSDRLPREGSFHELTSLERQRDGKTRWLTREYSPHGAQQPATAIVASGKRDDDTLQDHDLFWDGGLAAAADDCQNIHKSTGIKEPRRLFSPQPTTRSAALHEGETRGGVWNRWGLASNDLLEAMGGFQ